MPITDQWKTAWEKRVGSLTTMPPLRGGQRPSGALDELFIECSKRAADAAHFGHDHSRLCLRGTDRIIIFWLGGLRRALAYSLKSVRTENSSSKRRTATFSTHFKLPTPLMETVE